MRERPLRAHVLGESRGGHGGQLGLAQPAHARRMQQPGGGTEGGAANRRGSGTWHPLPSPVSHQPRARPRGGGGSPRSPWDGPLNQAGPHPRTLLFTRWEGELGQPHVRCTKALTPVTTKNASPTIALRPSHLSSQLIRGKKLGVLETPRHPRLTVRLV